jgi:hypothetical protein
MQDQSRFLTTRVSGNDGNATGCLGLSRRLDFIQDGCFGAGSSLDLIQARDHAAVEDVGSFGSDLGNNVAEFAVLCSCRHQIRADDGIASSSLAAFG